MFSNLSSSSISLATVTPSLVIRGAPKLFSSTTLRPFGPRVTFTALARTSTPRSIRSRASPENFTSLAAISNYSVGSDVMSGDHAHDVGLLHDQESSPSSLISVPNHLPNSTRLPGFRSIGISLASRTDSNDLALLRLLIGSVGNDDAAFGFLLGVDAAHKHAVVQGTKLGLGMGSSRRWPRVSWHGKCRFFSPLA